MKNLKERVAMAFRVMTSEEESQEKALDDRRRRLSAQNAIRVAGCPSRITTLILGDLSKTTALSTAMAFADAPRHEKWWLVLVGSVGSGKSTAAAWAARQVLFQLSENGRPSGEHSDRCRWVTGAELGRVYTHDRDLARDWEAMKRASVLVIDDLGTEGADSRSGEALWELVEARTSRVLPTILTSNLSVRDFKRRYGDRIADRVSPCSIILETNNESMRKAPF